MAIGKVGQNPSSAPLSRPRDTDTTPASAPSQASASTKWGPADATRPRQGGVTPKPSHSNATGATGAAAAGPTTQAQKDAAQLKDMKDLLSQSPTGAEAVKFLTDKKIPVEFARGGGSYWDGGKIVIDRSESSADAALTLVHELNHAKATKSNTSGDAQKQTRGDYVSTMLNEEVEGTVASIKAKNELVSGGKPITASFPLESQYNAAYKDGVDAAKAKNPKASEAELKAAGEKSGFDRVMKGFKDGEVVASTNGQKYTEYYGATWDRRHP